MSFERARALVWSVSLFAALLAGSAYVPVFGQVLPGNPFGGGGGGGGLSGTLTATRVPFASSASALTDDADMTFVTDTLTVTNVNVKAGTGTGVLRAGGTFCKGAPNTATTGTAEEVLATCTLPANTVSADGTTVDLRFYATTAANANNKQLRIRLGGVAGTLLYDSTAVALNNQVLGSGWGSFTRRSSTTVAAYIWASSGALAGTTSVTNRVYLLDSGTTDFTAQQDLVFTGTTPTASGDLTLRAYNVSLSQ